MTEQEFRVKHPHLWKRFMENYRLTYTPRRVNWLCFFIGMLTVGFATDWGWIPLIGAWVASLHFTINCDRFGQFK